MLLPSERLHFHILRTLPTYFLFYYYTTISIQSCRHSGLYPRVRQQLFCPFLLDLLVEAESGDAAVPVAVVAAAAAAPVQPGEGAPEDAAGRAADGAPEAAAPSAGGPLLCHAGPGARQAT